MLAEKLNFPEDIRHQECCLGDSVGSWSITNSVTQIVVTKIAACQSFDLTGH